MRSQFSEIASHIYGCKVIQQTFAEYPQDVNGCEKGTERVCLALTPEWCHQQGKTGQDTWAFLTILLPWVHLVTMPTKLPTPALGMWGSLVVSELLPNSQDPTS